MGMTSAASLPTANVEMIKAPVTLLWGAAGALLLGAGLLIPRMPVTSAMGYLLAPLVVTALVCVYTYRDIKASQSPMYAMHPNGRRVRGLLIGLAFVVGLMHAWIVATEIAKII